MSAALTIPQVRSWRPQQLDAAAATVGTASDKVEQQARSVRTALEQALTGAGGYWAQAASERAADEARTGVQLADALDLARTALKTGATDIGTARTKLLDTISAVESRGFDVSDDGTVTPPTLPPVMSSPEGAAAAVAERNAAQTRLNNQAVDHAEDIASALRAVGTADNATGEALGAISIPQTLESAVEAYIQRALASKDLLGALGSAGVGGVALAMALSKAVTVGMRTPALLSFFKASTAPITHYDAFLKNMGVADDALEEFMKGKANGGFARFFMGTKAAQVAGKAFIPLTALTGAYDAVTGGGYDGARGWATRGFGIAGAAGAGTLMASSAGFLAALGPVGVAVAGGAVLAYGAWSVGNLVYDNWDEIKEFTGNAVGWAGDRLDDAVDAGSRAVDWGRDRLADAGEKLEDAGKSVVKTMSFGLLG